MPRSVRRKPAAISPPPPAGRLPPGARFYAIGDVHGHVGLLAGLWARIEADAAGFPSTGPRAKVIFLGDYIDRGPDSAGVLHWLNRLRVSPPAWCEPVFLIGNHERMLLEFLRTRSPMTYFDWVDNGGAAALASFGIPETGRDEVARRLRAALRPELEEFFAATKLHHAEPGWLFVHAGIRPGVPLPAQDPSDLVWIREEFLDSDADHGFRVVHGHTPTGDGQVDIRANRINVDTGAFAGGTLSAVRIDAAGTAVLQFRAPRG